jgi:hypothetical protein
VDPAIDQCIVHDESDGAGDGLVAVPMSTCAESAESVHRSSISRTKIQTITINRIPSGDDGRYQNLPRRL